MSPHCAERLSYPVQWMEYCPDERFSEISFGRNYRKKLEKENHEALQLQKLDFVLRSDLLRVSEANAVIVSYEH